MLYARTVSFRAVKTGDLCANCEFYGGQGRSPLSNCEFYGGQYISPAKDRSCSGREWCFAKKRPFRAAKKPSAPAKHEFQGGKDRCSMREL